ncbi:MAG: phosphate/phosphite/phosphonate ABC transporter substrate-binding protein [Desulfurivibrionaceae bacterium]
MMLGKTLYLLMLLTFLTFSGCSNEAEPQKVSLEKRGKVSVEQTDKARQIRFAVGGMITPKEGLAYYKDFLDYIGEKLGEPVSFVDRENYGEINNMLENGALNLAFVCSGPYVDGHAKFGLELLVAPHVYGGTVYHSYIIVNKNSPITSFAELRGKKFAFTDPLSNSGKLVPTYMLAKIDETPETYFQNYLFAKSHDNSIKAVAQELVDGAAVDSLVWEYLNRTNDEHASQTRIIAKSPPFGIPPVVVPRNMDPQLKEKLREIFLNADSDQKGRQVLGRMMIDKFVVVDDQAYDSVREMKAWLAELGLD